MKLPKSSGVLPPVPEALLAQGFRREVLRFLVREQAISEELRARLLGWRHSGFSAHNQGRVSGDDPEGRGKLAGTMLRAPMSLEKMTYDAGTGPVICRSLITASPTSPERTGAKAIDPVRAATP